VAEQASGTVEGTGAGDNAGIAESHGTLAYDPAHLRHDPGRPVSWVGTSIVVVGFVIGGIAFVPAPHWVPFWIGVGVAIIGCLVLLFSKAMSTDWY
jgi:hypothetical protein